MKNCPPILTPQYNDNLEWIKKAEENKLVVGSQARILYADAEGRMKIAEAFNVQYATVGPNMAKKFNGNPEMGKYLNKKDIQGAAR